MAKQHNWVGESVSGTPGTGTINLGGALNGTIRFEDAFTTADTVHYSIEDGFDREIGVGTLTTGTPWTLARTTVLETLVSGVYDDTSPTAISLTSAALVSVDIMVDMPGTLVGSSYTQDGTIDSGAGTIPDDDTIPTFAEGNQVFSVAYIPKYANSLIRVYTDVNIWAATSSWASVALFKDGTGTDPAVASNFSYANATRAVSVPCVYEYTLSSKASVTFSVRYGLNSGTAYINSAGAAAQRHGGTTSTFLRIEEIRQ